MSKEVHPLLKTRYKVIADYPTNGYNVGDILIMPEGFNHFRVQGEGKKVSSGVDISRDGLYEGQISKYPHLFRKLQWYEDRDEKDIKAVKYVKDNGGRVYEILTWVFNGGNHITAGISERPFLIEVPHLLPATATDYQSFITNK